jgi:hypothetical protein
MAPSVGWAKRSACAIRSTASSCPGRPVWCAAERRPTPITFGFSSLVRWAAGSATSSQYRSVASTTVSFTARVTMPHGGISSPSILYRLRSSYGSTHGSMARLSRPVEAPSLGLQLRRKTPNKAEPARAVIQASMRGAPIPKIPMASQANDLVSTDRGQSRQCAQEYRSENRKWQTAIAAKRILRRGRPDYPSAGQTHRGVAAPPFAAARPSLPTASRPSSSARRATGGQFPARRHPHNESIREFNDYLKKSLDRNTTGRSAWACPSKNLRDARSSRTSRSRIN